MQLAFSLESLPFRRDHVPALFSMCRDVALVLQTPSPFRSPTRVSTLLFVGCLAVCGSPDPPWVVLSRILYGDSAVPVGDPSTLDLRQLAGALMLSNAHKTSGCRFFGSAVLASLATRTAARCSGMPRSTSKTLAGESAILTPNTMTSSPTPSPTTIFAAQPATYARPLPSESPWTTRLASVLRTSAVQPSYRLWATMCLLLPLPVRLEPRIDRLHQHVAPVAILRAFGVWVSG